MKRYSSVFLFLLLFLYGLELRAADSLGVNAHLLHNDVLDAIAAAGVPWIRIDVNWSDIQPQSNKYNWNEVDRVVSKALSLNLKMYATFAYTPGWASSGNIDGKSSTNDVPKPGLYETALKEAIKRYRGKIFHWGLWNEPNLSQFWEGSANQYVDLIVIPGSQSIKQECPECFVLGPDLANVGDTLNDFYNTIFSRAGDRFDIVTHHIYQTFPELDPWAGYTSDSFFNALEKKRTFSTRMSLYEALSKYNLTSKEVWITETGYRCKPPTDQSEMSNQRLYYELVLKAQIERGWWTKTFFYEIYDCGVDDPNCDIDGFGILRRTSVPDNTYQDNFFFKPAYYYLRDFLIQHPEFREQNTGDAGYQDTYIQDTYTKDTFEADAVAEDTGGQGVKKIIARRVDQTPVIDGDLKDFYTEEPVFLGTKDYVKLTTDSNGDSDISARFYFMWDDNNLYIAAIVRDDVVYNTEQLADMWKGDSIQIAFDADFDRTVGSYDKDGDYEIGFAYINNSISSYRWVAPDGANNFEIKAAFKRSGNEFIYEVSIPFYGLVPFSARIGNKAGISFLVNDNDGSGREGFVQFTEGIGAGKDPSAFGEILLGGGLCEIDAYCNSKSDCLNQIPKCSCTGEWSCNGRGMCEWTCLDVDAGYDTHKDISDDVYYDVLYDVQAEDIYSDKGLFDINTMKDTKNYLSCSDGACVEADCPIEYPYKTDIACLTQNNMEGFCCIATGIEDDLAFGADNYRGSSNSNSDGCSCNTLF